MLNLKHTVKSILANASIDHIIEIKYLLRYVLNMTAAQLIINNDYELNDKELANYQELYQKWRDDSFPLSYISGIREFYSRDFKVTSDTLIPRQETELLVDFIIAMAKHGARILDLGTGSGILAITCKLERPDLDVTAVDKYIDTLLVAKENAKNLDADVNFIISDWFNGVDGVFDLIVSNPPYIEEDSKYLVNLKHEPLYALTDFADGLSHYRRIITSASKYLYRNGYLLFEHGATQGSAIRLLMIKHGFINVKTMFDYAQLERITVGTYSGT